MKKLNTALIVTGVGYPPSKKGWDFLMQSYTETIAELVKGTIGETYTVNTPYVLYGCVKTSLGGSNYSYSAGAIFYNNEVYASPAVASIAIATSDVCTITTTNDPTADPTLMTDGSSINIHNIRAIVVSDAAAVTNGATQFNFSSAEFCSTNWTTVGIVIGDISVSAGTYVVVGGTFSYKIVGKVMHLRIRCNLTSAATTNQYFDFTIPGGNTSTSADISVGYSDGDVDEFLQVKSGGATKIRFSRPGLANFAAYTTGTELWTSVVIALA